jgi:broad specificity phosphatase PhoE
MKEFYFIRHGQTDCNKYDNGICYVEDAPLNKKGVKQAKKTGTYLKKYRMKDKPFDCILTSPRTRAKQTANIIADEINFSSIGSSGSPTSEVLKIEQIKELGRGHMNQYYDAQYQILEKIKDPIEYWKVENNIHKIIQEKYNLEHMDDIKDINKRLDDFIVKLKTMKENKVIVVSHYGFLFTALLPKIFNIPAEAIEHYTGSSPKEDNCAICYCTYDEVTDKFEMIMPPSTEHLKI